MGDALFPGSEVLDLDVEHEHGGARVHAVTGGQGPPLVLLHGYPQTHALWAGIAPALARDHTLVVPDLRGYGDSGKPADAADHGPPSFRAMAADAAAGHRVSCPLLVLWGAHGVVGTGPDDVLAVWRERAERDDLVTGQPIDAGHLLVDEAAVQTLGALWAFLAGRPRSSATPTRPPTVRHRRRTA